jgi:protein involved in ribonucleotide reduction
VGKGQEIVWQERFTTPSLNISENVKSFVKKGMVKVFQIDGSSDDSILADLGSAYDPNGLLFIIQTPKEGCPTLLCMIGERVSVSSVWKPAGKVVTAFQKQLFGRVKSGRPRNTKRFAQALKQRAKPGRLKSKVQVPSSGTAKDIASAQSFISRVDQKSRADTEQ